MQLEIKKIGRSWFIVAGVSKLGKFKTETAAAKSLSERKAFWEYWAGSLSVSYENREKKIIYV